MKQTEDDDFSLYLNSINDGDFIFVVDDSGALKTLLVPEEFEYDTTKMPPSLQQIFKLFDIENLSNQTIH